MEAARGKSAFKLIAQAATLLTEGTFLFQAGRSEPGVLGQAKGVKACRFLPRLRRQEERDALGGAYPDQPGETREKRNDREPEKIL
jgi:hypothetical protein